MEDNSRLATGDGHNALGIGAARDDAAVTLGGGDNMVAANLEGSASLLFGNGNNLWSGAATQTTSVEFGDGDNTVFPRKKLSREVSSATETTPFTPPFPAARKTT